MPSIPSRFRQNRLWNLHQSRSCGRGRLAVRVGLSRSKVRLFGLYVCDALGDGRLPQCNPHLWLVCVDHYNIWLGTESTVPTHSGSANTSYTTLLQEVRRIIPPCYPDHREMWTVLLLELEKRKGNERNLRLGPSLTNHCIAKRTSPCRRSPRGSRLPFLKQRLRPGTSTRPRTLILKWYGSQPSQVARCALTCQISWGLPTDDPRPSLVL